MATGDVKLSRRALEAALDQLREARGADRLLRFEYLSNLHGGMLLAAMSALLRAMEPASDEEVGRHLAQQHSDHALASCADEVASWRAAEARARRLANFTDDALAAGAGDEGGER